MDTTTTRRTPKSPEPAPPQTVLFSEESERLALALMMQPDREKTQHHLAEILAADDFFVEQHQAIWGLIVSLRGAGLPSDSISIADAANRSGVFIGGAAYLASIADDPIARRASDDSVKAACARVKSYSLSRRLISTLKQGIALCESGQGFESVIGLVEDDLQNLKKTAKSSRTGARHVSTFLQSVMAKMDAQMEGTQTDDAALTGHNMLDQTIGGLLPENLIIVAGRPSMGKTAFADGIVQNISTIYRRPTLTFSLEMTGIAITTRRVARHGRIPLGHLKTAELTDNEWSSFSETIDTLGSTPSYIDDTPGLTLSEIRSRSRAFIAEHPNGVIEIDYLQLIAPESGKGVDRNRHIADVSAGLKLMARELRAPVVALAQLSRDLEKRANKRPMLSDLRESGQIEQDAEIILFIYRDEWYNPDTPDKGITEVIVGKNRDGETKTIKFAHNLATMSYTEFMETYHE